MKKMMYVMLGVLLLVPVIATTQVKADSIQTDRKAAQTEAIQKLNHLVAVPPLLVTLQVVSNTNRMFGAAHIVVLQQINQEGEPSFEAMDLLGMSLNSLQDPYNIKTTGEHHKRVNEEYKQKVVVALDKVFAALGVPLKDLAAHVQQANPDKQLVNAELFAQLDGTYLEKTQQTDK